jgi:hypothetical protein
MRRSSTTIDTDLRAEIDYLVRFDAAWRALREIVDMPDRRLELFVKLCLGNDGRLAAGKRNQFAELSDAEIAGMEDALRDAGLLIPRQPPHSRRRLPTADLVVDLERVPPIVRRVVAANRTRPSRR